MNEILYGSDPSSPESPQKVGENTCRLLAEPNKKNFVIFYASVECKLFMINYNKWLIDILQNQAHHHSAMKWMALTWFKISASY